jgi:hypothetical protein
VVVVAGAASAQPPGPPVAESLRVEWERVTDPPRVVGYVYNDSPYRIGLVRLRMVTRDEGELLAWVHGNVPARGRWSFNVRVPPPREVVQVTIESFSLIALEKPAESP